MLKMKVFITVGKKLLCSLSHRKSCNPATGPGRLEIKSACDAVDIEALAGEVEAGDALALHCFEINFFKGDAAAGDELILIGGLALDIEAGVDEFFDEGGFFVFGELGPFLVFGDTNHFDQALPEPAGEGVEDFRFDEGLALA